MISPELGTKMPVNILMEVDLPAPFGPMYPTISPRAISKEMLSTALTGRYSRSNRLTNPPRRPSRRLKVRNSLESSRTRMRGADDIVEIEKRLYWRAWAQRKQSQASRETEYRLRG